MTYFVVAAISAFIWLSVIAYLYERDYKDVYSYWGMYAFFAIVGSALWPLAYPLAAFVLGTMLVGRGTAKLVNKKEGK
jgi:hypothetical protein